MPTHLRSARVALRVIALACVAWGLYAALSDPQDKAPANTTEVAYQARPAERRLATKPIRDLRPGMRVLAQNPELSGQAIGESQIAPEAWALVSLEQAKPGGGKVEVRLLRPKAWVVLQALGVIARSTDTLPPSDGPTPELSD